MQSIINDWFDLRYVCDDDTFPVFFKRLLERDYNRYLQLLSIEPGYSEFPFEWLTNLKVAREGQDSKTGSGADTTTRTGTVDVEVDSTKTNTSTVTDSGTKSGTHEDTDTYDTTDTRRDSASGSRNGSNTSETESSNSNTQTLNTKDATTDETDAESNGASLEKAAPMSVEYAVTTGGVTQQLPPLSWNSLTSQHQDGETSHSDGSSTTDHTGTVSDSGTGDSTTTDTTTETTTTQGTGTLEKDGTITRDGEYSEITGNTRNLSGTDTGDIDTKTTYDTENTRTNSSFSQGTNSGKESGQTLPTADLLSKAKAYILQTTAWEWFYKRLDTCFLGYYEI